MTRGQINHSNFVFRGKQCVISHKTTWPWGGATPETRMCRGSTKFPNYKVSRSLCTGQPQQRAPPPRLHWKATAPSPTAPHMYQRKQSCIKLGDLLPLGQLSAESHFIQFGGAFGWKILILHNEIHEINQILRFHAEQELLIILSTKQKKCRSSLEELTEIKSQMRRTCI